MKRKELQSRMRRRAVRRIRGIHLTFAAPAVIEVLAAVDLRLRLHRRRARLLRLARHRGVCIAAERHDLTPIARIPDLSSATITRFLDRGVRGIVVPHVESLDDAQRVIDAAYFAPLGNRSFGAGRPEYWERTATARRTCARATARCRSCMMIESERGLDIARRPDRAVAGRRLPELRPARSRAVARAIRAIRRIPR